MANRKGEKHHMAKLSDDDVRLMRALREKYGLPFSVIGEKFECPERTANAICNYETRAYAGTAYKNA